MSKSALALNGQERRRVLGYFILQERTTNVSMIGLWGNRPSLKQGLVTAAAGQLQKLPGNDIILGEHRTILLFYV